MTRVTGFEDFAEDAHDFAEGLEESSGDGIVTVGDAVAEDTAETVVDYAQQYVPVETGQLRENIFMHPIPPQPMERLVLAATDYARHVEYGTFEHFIPPSPETTYNKPVAHPGAEMNPFLRTAIHSSIRTMHREFSYEIEDLFRRNLR